jgi:hypothetical protein
MKKFFIVLSVCFFIAYMAFKLVVFLYEINTPYSISEIKRVSNFDGSLEAVLANRETGATDSTPVLVYIVPKGFIIADNAEPVLTALDVDSIDLIWLKNDRLLIKSNEAIIYSFSGYTYIHTKDMIKVYVGLNVDKFYK